jgi:YesN/AraC family two-component response regulator
MITGNIYKIFAIILSQFTEISADVTKDMKAVANIEKALDLISRSYAEPITVDMAANLTGYGKSNFCKIFKNIVGDTFHNVLNRKRIENALVYLEETAMPVAEISSAVGFSDVKSFCRVFRSITGKTAGEARKIKIHNQQI